MDRKKAIRMSILVIVFMVLLLVYALSKLMMNSEEDYKIYKQSNNIYSGHDILIENVVDYTLTSLDEKNQHVLVLHTDRSDNIDIDGYEKAMNEGHQVGGFVRFYDLKIVSHELKAELIYENDFSPINPWCIDAGHMDDDGLVDVFVGAYRATEVYEADRRPFLLEWKNDKLERVWTGSYLNLKTFYKAGFEDMDNDGFDELYAIQPNKEGGISKYYYIKGNFTFHQVGEEEVSR